MERLTEKNDETYFYPHCFGEKCIGVSEPCSECEFEEKICIRLGEYEDTGLTPKQIRKLKDRDTGYFAKTSIFDHESVVCKCRNDIEKDSGFKFCPYCGQRIKWED